MKRPTNRALRLLRARLEDKLHTGTAGDLPAILRKIDQINRKIERTKE
jgi:hypothetical protein